MEYRQYLLFSLIIAFGVPPLCKFWKVPGQGFLPQRQRVSSTCNPAEDITVHSPIIVDGKACDLQGGDVAVYASFADFKVLHKGPGRHLLFLIQLVEDYP